jgi:uncharacterized protein (TIGR02646 family)
MRFNRPTTAPDCLQTEAASWRDAWVSRRSEDSKAKWKWPDDACAQEIRKALNKAHDGHCAFCDDFGAKSEIEHFYSKTGSPDLAFEWTNLFPACHDCNAEKLARQPTGSTLKPDDATFEFTDYFYVTSNGRLEINPAASEDQRRSASALIDIYKLNRTELCESRQDQIEHPTRSPKRFRFLPRPEPFAGTQSFVQI